MRGASRYLWGGDAHCRLLGGRKAKEPHPARGSLKTLTRKRYDSFTGHAKETESRLLAKKQARKR